MLHSALYVALLLIALLFAVLSLKHSKGDSLHIWATFCLALALLLGLLGR